MKSLRIAILASLPVLLCPALALAQGSADAWPSKPVTLVNPSSPDGSTNAEMRLYATRLGEILGKPFVMDYKPGAGGTIGAAFVARSAPDGYTIQSISTAFTSSAAFYGDLPYDPVKDFQPVSLLTKRVVMFVARPNAPFKNFKEYIAYGKANPGKLNFGTSGQGGSHHLIAAQLHSFTGVEAAYVHYKNVAAKVADIEAGRIDAIFNSIFSGARLVKAGKFQLLTLMDPDRSAVAPEWTTITDEGLPAELAYPAWIGMSAPARTPMPIINKLNATLGRIVREPEVAKRFEADAIVVVASTPAQFQQVITQEITRWRSIADKIGVKGVVD